MKTLDRGDAPPFDAAAFARDAVVPIDQKVALDRVPGWALGDAAAVRCARRVVLMLIVMCMLVLIRRSRRARDDETPVTRCRLRRTRA